MLKQEPLPGVGTTIALLCCTCLWSVFLCSVRCSRRCGPRTIPKGPKYLYGIKYGFCSSNFPYGLGKYTPYGYLGPFGNAPLGGLGSAASIFGV